MKERLVPFKIIIEMQKYPLLQRTKVLLAVSLSLLTTGTTAGCAHSVSDTLLLNTPSVALTAVIKQICEKNLTGSFVLSNEEILNNSFVNLEQGKIAFGQINFRDQRSFNIKLNPIRSLYSIKRIIRGDTVESWMINDSNFLKEGQMRIYYPNHKLKEIRTYLNGEQVGLHEYWFENGKKRFSRLVCHGYQDSSNCNYLNTTNCLGELNEYSWQDEWYDSGSVKFKFELTGKNEYRYTYYSKSGHLISQVILSKEVIDYCINPDNLFKTPIYFLTIKNKKY